MSAGRISAIVFIVNTSIPIAAAIDINIAPALLAYLPANIDSVRRIANINSRPAITAIPLARSEPDMLAISFITSARIPIATAILSNIVPTFEAYLELSSRNLHKNKKPAKIAKAPTITTDALPISLHDIAAIAFIVSANIPIAIDIRISIVPARCIYLACIGSFTKFPNAATTSISATIRAVSCTKARSLSSGSSSAIIFIHDASILKVTPKLSINTASLAKLKFSNLFAFVAIIARTATMPTKYVKAKLAFIRSSVSILDSTNIAPANIAKAIASVFTASAITLNLAADKYLSALFNKPAKLFNTLVAPSIGLDKASAMLRAFLIRSNTAIIEPATNSSFICISNSPNEPYSLDPNSFIKLYILGNPF